MKKYIIKIAIGLLLIIITDFIIGNGLSYLYFKQTSGLLYRTTFSIDKTEADIVIFGTSRANHHYNTKILEEKTGMTSYNTGRDGNFIFYQTALLKSILKRYTPKQIILDFTGTFKYDQSDYDRLAALLPYYNTNPELRDIILLKSPSEKYKLLSKIYPFNSRLTTIILGNLELNKKRKNQENNYNGYVPLYNTFHQNIDSLYTPTLYEIDSIKYQVFGDFLKLTKLHNISTLVVYSPVYYMYEKDFSIELCKHICTENNVKFIDFSKSPVFLNDNKLFKDIIHLNNDGACLFTQMIIDSLYKQ